MLALLLMQFPPEPQREIERQWTCSLIGALVEEAEAGFGERPPDLFLVSDRFRPALRADSAAAFLESLRMDRHVDYIFPMPQENPFYEAVNDFPFGVVMQAYANWPSEEPIICPDLTGAEQVSPEVAEDRLDALIDARRLRTYLPAFSPDHLPPLSRGTCGLTGEEVPSLRFIEITRPAFSENGLIAFFATPNQRFIYERGWRTPWRQVAVTFPNPC
ncbi:MAG: hypothetical protein KDA21_15040 [Phycisphaerales bacterium]|nr:hypothetical protein [Phycisphaerales bacterium]